MAGSKLGGQKAALTNKRRYGANYYSMIGRKGGLKGTRGGFNVMKEEDPERLREVSRRGGSNGKPFTRQTISG